MTISAPIDWAIIAAPRPTGPAPITAIFSPACGFAVRDGVVADAENLHCGRLIETHIVGQRIQVEVGHRRVLGIRAVLIEPHRPQLLAEVGPARPAGTACAASEINVAANPLASEKIPDAFAGCHNFPGELVAEYPRERETRMLAVESVKVRPADRTRVNLDHDLVRPRRRIGNGLVTQITAAVQ